MCTFITAFLPAATSLAAVAPYFEKQGIGFTQITNPSVMKQVKTGDIYLFTTRGMCDCDTPLGRLCDRDENARSQALEMAEQIKQFRKKGWGEAKIQRWREQKAQNAANNERLIRENQELTKWLTFLPELLYSGHTARIGLLMHFYNGSLENETIKLKGQEHIPLQDLNADRLLHLCENVVYYYVP